MDRDLARMAQARDVVGDDVELYVDASSMPAGASKAVRVMHQAADLDIRWIEEPGVSDDLAGLARSPGRGQRRRRGGRIRLRHLLFSPDVSRARWTTYQADASRCGGITGCCGPAAVAAAHGLQISGHCAPHLHAAAAMATPNLRHLEWFTTTPASKCRIFDGQVLRWTA